MKHLAHADDLADWVGRRVLRARRLFYDHDGRVDRSVGPLELQFDDVTVLLDAGSDGESLALSGPWRDPFEGELSEENAAFVATSGKWSVFDVSEERGYRDLIGAQIVDVVPIRSAGGKCVGAVIETTGAAVRAEVEADELHVDVVGGREQ